MPTAFSAPTQVKNLHGSVTVTANALGYARVFMNMYGGSISIYNDVAHTETVLGAISVITANDTDFTTANLTWVCAAGLRLRSLASNLNDAGTM